MYTHIYMYAYLHTYTHTYNINTHTHMQTTEKAAPQSEADILGSIGDATPDQSTVNGP